MYLSVTDYKERQHALINPWGLEQGMELGLFVQIYSLPAGPDSEIQNISYNVIRNIQQGLCGPPGHTQLRRSQAYYPNQVKDQATLSAQTWHENSAGNAGCKDEFG